MSLMMIAGVGVNAGVSYEQHKSSDAGGCTHSPATCTQVWRGARLVDVGPRP